MSTDQKTTDWYDHNAAAYTRHVRNPEQSIYHAYYEKPAMYALLPDLAGRTVISLGCGSGEDASYLQEHGARQSVGIDVSEKLLDIARADHPACQFELMDMERLRYADESYDFAYSSLALSHIRTWERVLYETYRILRPGSQFLFSCAHPLATAMALEKVETSKIWTLRIEKDKKHRTTAIQGDYLHQHPSPNGISEEVTTWHRPFGQMFAEILAAGFAIKAVVEPSPLPEMQRSSPVIYQSLRAVPTILIMRLEKPDRSAILES